MGKYCFEAYAFQQQMNDLMVMLSKLQEEIEEHDKEIEEKRKKFKALKEQIKTMALKGDCEKCKHRVECITTNKEKVDVKIEHGW